MAGVRPFSWDEWKQGVLVTRLLFILDLQWKTSNLYIMDNVFKFMGGFSSLPNS